MTFSTYEQFAIVREDSAALLTEKLNEQVYALRQYKPVVTFSDSDPLCAYISPVLKDDGEQDKRCKWGNCEHAEFGRTYKTSPACDKLYDLIREGDVKLCFTD